MPSFAINNWISDARIGLTHEEPADLDADAGGLALYTLICLYRDIDDANTRDTYAAPTCQLFQYALLVARNVVS